MDEAKERFEKWAIVELLGHRKVAGLVTEEINFGTPLLRVDIPEVPACPPDMFTSGQPPVPAFTQYYGGSSIYSLTPVTEEIARRFSAALRVRPVEAYQLPKLPALAAAETEDNADVDHSAQPE